MAPYRGARRGFLPSRDEATPIHWRRGLLRVWLLISAAWIMGWAIYSILHAISNGFRTLGDLLSIPVVFFGPPVALLLVGLAAAWAFLGFSAGPPQSKE